MPLRSRLALAASLLLCATLLAGCGLAGDTSPDAAEPGTWRPTSGASAARIAGSAQFGPTTGHAPPSVVAPAGPVHIKRHPGVDCAIAKCVALTFDDGPGKYTEGLLDLLARENVPATFFLLGQNVQQYPHALQRMVTEGHQLGSHTFTHPDLTTLPPERVADELESTNEAIRKITGFAPDTVRPPYGAHNGATDRLIHDPLILWDVDTLDWQHHDPARTVSVAMEAVRGGSIILLHDIHKTSVQAVPELIGRLKGQGYSLVTIDELFAGTELSGGQALTRRPVGGQA